MTQDGQHEMLHAAAPEQLAMTQGQARQVCLEGEGCRSMQLAYAGTHTDDNYYS